MPLDPPTSSKGQKIPTDRAIDNSEVERVEGPHILHQPSKVSFDSHEYPKQITPTNKRQNYAMERWLSEGRLEGPWSGFVRRGGTSDTENITKRVAERDAQHEEKVVLEGHAGFLPLSSTLGVYTN